MQSFTFTGSRSNGCVEQSHPVPCAFVISEFDFCTDDWEQNYIWPKSDPSLMRTFSNFKTWSEQLCFRFINFAAGTEKKYIKQAIQVVKYVKILQTDRLIAIAQI